MSGIEKTANIAWFIPVAANEFSKCGSGSRAPHDKVNEIIGKMPLRGSPVIGDLRSDMHQIIKDGCGRHDFGKIVRDRVLRFQMEVRAI